jgi:hypothetical protein
MFAPPSVSPVAAGPFLCAPSWNGHGFPLLESAEALQLRIAPPSVAAGVGLLIAEITVRESMVVINIEPPQADAWRTETVGMVPRQQASRPMFSCR